jgi:hypothetical protein
MYLKKHVFFNRLIVFIISVSMILALTSCSPQKKPVPKAKSKQEENKPPKELESLSKAVEKIEKTLVKMHENSKKPLFIQQEEIQKKNKTKEQGGQGQQSQQQGGGGGGSSGGSGGSSGGGSGGQSQQPTQVDLVTPEAQNMQTKLELSKMKDEIEKENVTQFEKLKEDVTALHGLWNAYEAKAVTPVGIQTSVADFEAGLNSLTKSINNQDAFQSLIDVTQLYKYLPDFEMAYTPEKPLEIGKVRFAIKKIQLLSEKKDYAGAKEVSNYLNSVWILTRPKLNKESKDMVNQVEIAIIDLNKAIESKDDTIVAAKAEVILKLADKLEKANEKKEKKK